MKRENPMVADTILKNKVERLTLPSLKTFYKAIVFKSLALVTGIGIGIGERTDEEICEMQ